MDLIWFDGISISRFPMISGQRKLFQIAFDSENDMQIALSQNQVVWLPTKISSFPRHVEGSYFTPILSDRLLKQAWGSDLRVSGGEGDSQLLFMFESLGSLVRALRHKTLRICVYNCMNIYIYIHIYMCVCEVVTEVRNIAQRSLAHIFVLYSYVNIKHCPGDVTWGMFVWNGLCTQCQGCQEHVSFLEAFSFWGSTNMYIWWIDPRSCLRTPRKDHLEFRRKSKKDPRTQFLRKVHATLEHANVLHILVHTCIKYQIQLVWLHCMYTI